MANFTIADIKALRDQLGTGMVDTKKALEEAEVVAEAEPEADVEAADAAAEEPAKKPAAKKPAAKKPAAK